MKEQRWIEQWEWNGQHYVCLGLVGGPLPGFAAALEEIRRRQAGAATRRMYFAVTKENAAQAGTLLGG